jgi:hypothetical protein
MSCLSSQVSRNRQRPLACRLHAEPEARVGSGLGPTFRKQTRCACGERGAPHGELGLRDERRYSRFMVDPFRDPEWLRAMRETQRRLARQIEEPVRRMNELGAHRYFEQMDRIRAQVMGPAQVVRRMRETIEGPARQLQRTYEQLNRALEPYDIGAVLREAAEAGRRFELAFRQSLPSNWRQLSFEDAKRAQQLVVEHGIPIIWVPNPELTEKVLAAPGRNEAQTALNSERDSVLTDIETALTEVSDGQLTTFVAMARRAVAAALDDHPEAAQALASAVLTATLDQGLGFARFGEVRDWAEKHPPDEAGLGSYRTTLVLDLAARYVLGWGNEKPGYNRNKTLHTISGDQYTEEHSLLSLMAMTALLREIQERITARASESEDEAQAA